MRRYRCIDDNAKSLIASDPGRLDLLNLFGRQAPLRLEIGFGHGEFLSAMAASHPEVDFLGVERQEIRVNKTAYKSAGLSATNVRLFQAEAHEFIQTSLPDACLERCYILFSDPWPKMSHRRRRLVNRAFLIDCARIMAPGGKLIFASDTHNYAMQVLSNAADLGHLWKNCYDPPGYRFNIPTRFPTTFEVHKKAEGWDIAYVCLQRVDQALKTVLMEQALP
jgi:tRNA (guanine-N7-)-methyltransferase